MSKINKIKVDNTIYDIEDANKPSIVLIDGTTNISSPPTDATTLTKIKNAIINAYNNNTQLKIVFSVLTYYSATYPTVVFDLIEADTNRIYARTSLNVFSTTSNFTNNGIKFAGSCGFTLSFSADATEIANHALTELYDVGTTTPMTRINFSSTNPQPQTIYEVTSLIGKDNTSSWTPTKNYGLVHKKYVDDLISGVSSLNLQMTTYPSTQNNQFDFRGKKAGIYMFNFYSNTGTDYWPFWYYITSSANGRLYTMPMFIVILKDLPDTIDVTQFEANETFAIMCEICNDQLQWRHFRRYSSNDSIEHKIVYLGQTLLTNSNSNQIITGVKKFSTIPQYYNSVLTPTTDLQLTNKKYVDDKPTTYTGYDATKTQVLKNINGTLTWVDE